MNSPHHMRKFRFSKPLPAEDKARLLAFWDSLNSSSPLLKEPAIQQPRVNDLARFVISLARQYQRPALGTEALLAAAHDALVAFLHQNGNQPEVFDRRLAHVLREAMIQLVSESKPMDG